MQDVPKTFLLNNIEVIYTGRTAKRKLKSGKYDLLVEVTPMKQLDGSWTKWIREAELYEINNEK